MWRLWSKKSLKLAIAADSIAVRDSHGKIQLLSSQATDFALMSDLLEQSQAPLKQQYIEVVLSHHFVRFLVLPWQINVVQLQDWQAIAQHAFKKEFGSIANNWQVTVHLYGYGKSVFATAIDKSLMNHLVEASQRHDFKIEKISPLLNECWTQHLTEKDWLLIAEPQRLLLVQMCAGICQEIAVDMPPLGQEQIHAEQLVQRTLIQLSPSLRPARVLAFVSGEIQSAWQKEEGSMIKLVNPHAVSQTHAAWMGHL